MDSANDTQHPNAACVPSTEPVVPPGTTERKRQAKRHKADVSPAVIEVPEPPGSCQLSRLPLELLAEILISTYSPKDVLAVARTSKYFCNTLLSSSSTFIWRGARQTCHPQPLPDPISTFTESSYASFLFDGGLCEVRIMVQAFRVMLIAVNTGMQGPNRIDV